MGDYVHLMHPNDPERPIIGQVFKCYVPDRYVMSPLRFALSYVVPDCVIPVVARSRTT